MFFRGGSCFSICGAAPPRKAPQSSETVATEKPKETGGLAPEQLDAIKVSVMLFAFCMRLYILVCLYVQCVYMYLQVYIRGTHLSVYIHTYK